MLVRFYTTFIPESWIMVILGGLTKDSLFSTLNSVQNQIIWINAVILCTSLIASLYYKHDLLSIPLSLLSSSTKRSLQDLLFNIRNK